LTKLERIAVGSRLRRLFQNPYKLLASIELSSGHVFLDIGCGRGFLSLPAASVVGEHGVVYAVDVKDDYLREVERRAALLGMENIVTVKTRAEDLNGVPIQSVDRAVFMLSLHHLEDIRLAFHQVRRRLKDDGLLMVFDTVASRFFGHGTNPMEVINLLKQASFKPVFLKEGIMFWQAIARAA